MPDGIDQGRNRFLSEHRDVKAMLYEIFDNLQSKRILSL